MNDTMKYQELEEQLTGLLDELMYSRDPVEVVDFDGDEIILRIIELCAGKEIW